MQTRVPEVSRWSTSTESEATASCSARSEQSQRTAPRSPLNMSISETRDNVLTRIRSFVKSPARKNNDFQTLQSAPNSYADIQYSTPPTPLTRIPTIRTIRSGRTIVSRDKSSDGVPKADIPKGLRKRTVPAQTSPPKVTSPRTPAPKTSPSSPVSKSAASSGSYELSPLSTLIKQSYADIAVLRRKHTLPSPTRPSPAYSPRTVFRGGLSKSPQEKEEQQALIDFDKIEDNLKKFEEMYKGFLRSGEGIQSEAEEVHLVAVVCKRGDVARGTLGEGEGVPTIKRVWGDCGF